MDKYTGFFIEKLCGNNIFSYEERTEKKIFVPKLINGDLNDVKCGNTVSFAEVDENGVENLCFGIKNMVEIDFKNNKKVYIFDNHNHSFYFWCKALNENLIKKGMTLVHVDQHKDTRVPDNYNVDVYNMDDVFKYTNEVLNVGSFIKPALEKDIFSELIIVDSTYSLGYKIPEKIVLDIDLDFFSKDMDYIDMDVKIDRVRYYIEKADIITIATSPYFIEQKRAIDVLKRLFD